MDFITLDNIVRYASPELRERFRDASMAFDRFYHWSHSAMLDLSRKTGWVGPTPLSFDGFSGVHVECGADCFELFDGDEVLGRVSLEGTDGLRLEGMFEGMSEREVHRETYRLLLDKNNVAAARDYTAGGRMLVQGFLVRGPEGKRAVFAAEPVPFFGEAMMSAVPQIFGEDCRLELLPSSDYVRALNAQLAIPEGGKVHGVSARPEIPEGFRLTFNGRTVDYMDNLAREDHSLRQLRQYIRNLDALGRFCNESSLALNCAAGLKDAGAAGQSLYHFETANYIMTAGTVQGIVLTSGFGTGRLAFISPDYEHDDLFVVTDPKMNHVADLTLSELTGWLNRKLFSDENIAKVRTDFRTAGFALEPDRKVQELLRIEYKRDKALVPSL